jgi:hypothetical protein
LYLALESDLTHSSYDALEFALGLFSTFTSSVIPTEQVPHVVWFLFLRMYAICGFYSSRNAIHDGFVHHFIGWSQDNPIVQGRI